MKTGTKCELRLTVKAQPAPGLTLDELEQRLIAAGNKIISREDDGIVIAQTTETAYEMRTP